MSTTTSNFGLFKYDTTTDGQLAFNINQALNNNWDIIDENLGSASIATYDNPGIVKPDGQSIYIDDEGLLSMGSHGFIISSSHIGTTWYREYSDGFKMCGGQVTTSASEIAFSRPNLSSNGTLGGNSFAVYASDYYSKCYPYCAVDGVNITSYKNGNQWLSQDGVDFIFYNPVAIKVSSLNIKGGYGSTYRYRAYQGTVSASNTNSNYTQIGSWSVSSTTDATASITVSLSSNNNYYKYYKLHPSAFISSTYWGISELYITATYQGGSGTNIIFPISFSDTNYSFQLGFQGGSGASTYVSTKSATGMTLSSTPSGTCSYICMGW